MRDLKKHEQAAIAAVAREFSSTWEKSGAPAGFPAAYLRAAGKRVALDVTTLAPRGVRSDADKLRLRFDKVVTRLIDRLQAGVGAAVPENTTVLLAVTAPIRLPAKTAASLEEKIQALLNRGFSDETPGGDQITTLHGNKVRIRLLKNESAQAPKIIGFVHNADSDPLLLLNMTCEWHRLISTAANRRPPRPAGNRWLIAISDQGTSCLPAYRYIHSRLRTPADYEKILIVFADERVGVLTGL